MPPVERTVGRADDAGQGWANGMGLRLGVLGPLTASWDGTSLYLGGPRQRVILGMLALHANTLVHRERIIDAVWAEQPPASAVNPHRQRGLADTRRSADRRDCPSRRGPGPGQAP